MSGLPLYRIVVTADGRFDYFAGETAAIRANLPTKEVPNSLGPNPDLPLLRFALQSVSDVSATPIDPSVYSEKRRRDVTLEEAHELVTAFLHARRSTGFSLEEYKDTDSPGIQFFQVLGDDPYGSVHYAVELKTGEVWSEAPCRNLTSPAVEKLQKAIRHRIGLTTDEFRKVRRRGPLCNE